MKPTYVIRSEQERGYWNNNLGWVLHPTHATLFRRPPDSLPSIGVPDCEVVPFSSHLLAYSEEIEDAEV